MKKKVLLIVCILLFGCTPKNNIEITPTPFSYIRSYALNSGGLNYIIEHYDGEKGYLSTFHTIADVSYDYVDLPKNQYYLFGPGGLFKYDLNLHEVEKISNKDITLIAPYNKELYLIENAGFSENGYTSNLYKNDEFLCTINYPTHSMIIYDDFIYITTFPYNLDGNQIFILKYDLNGYLIEKTPKEEVGNIIAIENEIYYITPKEIENLNHHSKKTFNYPLYSINDTLYSLNPLITVDIDWSSQTCYVTNHDDNKEKQINNCNRFRLLNDRIILNIDGSYQEFDISSEELTDLKLNKLEHAILENFFVIDYE